MEDLHALEAWAGTLLSKLTPASRRRIALDIARELRRSQKARIAAQRNPDGSAYVPRKRAKQQAGKRHLRAKAGRIKRQAMFAKLRTARYLKADADGNGAVVGFAGRVARIARVHQEGEAAPVAPGGPDYQYPRRVLLGLTNAERELIRDRLLAHLSKGI
jgi:phage virion morphogenesis protein